MKSVPLNEWLIPRGSCLDDRPQASFVYHADEDDMLAAYEAGECDSIAIAKQVVKATYQDWFCRQGKQDCTALGVLLSAQH